MTGFALIGILQCYISAIKRQRRLGSIRKTHRGSDRRIIIESKEKTKELLEKIKGLLDKNLKLELNSKTAYFKQNQGINYCGFRIWKTHRLLREQSKKKMKRKLKNFQKLYKKGKIE